MLTWNSSKFLFKMLPKSHIDMSPPSRQPEVVSRNLAETYLLPQPLQKKAKKWHATLKSEWAISNHARARTPLVPRCQKRTLRAPSAKIMHGTGGKFESSSLSFCELEVPNLLVSFLICNKFRSRIFIYSYLFLFVISLDQGFLCKHAPITTCVLTSAIGLPCLPVPTSKGCE